jgi:hypothetical protein
MYDANRASCWLWEVWPSTYLSTFLRSLVSDADNSMTWLSGSSAMLRTYHHRNPERVHWLCPCTLRPASSIRVSKRFLQESSSPPATTVIHIHRIREGVVERTHLLGTERNTTFPLASKNGIKSVHQTMQPYIGHVGYYIARIKIDIQPRCPMMADRIDLLKPDLVSAWDDWAVRRGLI